MRQEHSQMIRLNCGKTGYQYLGLEVRGMSQALKSMSLTFPIMHFDSLVCMINTHFFQTLLHLFVIGL